MEKYDDFDAYNGDSVYDGSGDPYYNENIDSFDVFNESTIDEYIDNLNDWD